MKKQFMPFILFLILLVGVLSACATDMPSIADMGVSSTPTPILDTVPSEAYETTLAPTPDSPSSVVFQTWQDAYAEFLRALDSATFYLCDIDGDEIPELLTQLFSEFSDINKYAEYSVYTFNDGTIKYIGGCSTLNSSSFWLDDTGGILGYDYGAGEGGTYRAYIDNGVLCYDGEIYGYYYGKDGNFIEWFKGSDGNEIIVTEETESEYEQILESKIELERYDNSEENIAKVICGGVSA